MSEPTSSIGKGTFPQGQPGGEPVGGVSQSTEFSAKFAVLQRLQAIGRWQTGFAVLAVAGLFGIFAKNTYDDVTGNFTPGANKTAAQLAIAQITPEAARAFAPALQEVLPAYQKIAAERYPGVRDRVSQAALDELHALPAATGKILASALTTGLDNALKNIGPDVEKTFPALTDPVQRDLLTVYLHDAIAERNQTLADKVNTITTNEAARVHAVLEKLQVSARDSTKPDSQQNDELVQTLLNLAAQELLRAAKPEASGNIPTASLGEP